MKIVGDFRQKEHWGRFLFEIRVLFPVHLVLLAYQNRLGSAWDPFEVSPDGKRFLVNSSDQPQAAEPINVVVNWDALLKK